MRIEIGEQRPEHFVETWPHQYDVFSHLELASGIPSALYAITTVKDNGKPNIAPQAWSSFSGGADGFYAIIPAISRQSHTYANLHRDGEFVINFLSKQYFHQLMATIEGNGDDADEFAVAKLTREPAKTVSCPRIAEAFLCLECKLEQEVDYMGKENKPLLIAKVQHMAMQEAYAGSIDGKYGEDGFMFNVNEPINLVTGKGGAWGAATCRMEIVEGTI